MKYYSDPKVNDKSKDLLPFRCWQIYNEMVAAVKAGDMTRFVCAAGILSHYVGDACHPQKLSLAKLKAQCSRSAFRTRAHRVWALFIPLGATMGCPDIGTISIVCAQSSLLPMMQEKQKPVLCY
jgi:hypothetical protein